VEEILEWDEDLTGLGWPVCPDCFDFMFNTPGLLEACAAVGQNHNKDTDEVLRSVVDEHHRQGHPA